MGQNPETSENGIFREGEGRLPRKGGGISAPNFGKNRVGVECSRAREEPV